ncbi:MAG: DNA mismatch repair protein MutS [Planctomycetota bacterium]
MASASKPPTPMMQQYHEAKEAAGDALLLFRMGDFYELFFEDAKTAAAMLGLSLTSRDKGENPVPMAGFPHHQLDQYLAKIIAAGRRAAVCEQVEDPRQAKGIVRREVTRVVSRGTVTDDALLDPAENNFLLAVAPGEPCGLAWIDVSTGRFEAGVCDPFCLPDEVARLEPAELLTSDDAAPLPAACSEKRMVTGRPGWAFGVDAAYDALRKQFGVQTLDGFGFTEDDAPAVRAAGAVIDYLNETQPGLLANVDRVTPYRVGQSLEIDAASRRSLEITQTLRDGRREGSLWAVIDRTVTSAGARLLGDWLANPLTDPRRIEARLEAVDELVGDESLTKAIREQLRGVYDTQRLLSRVVSGRASPRDLSFVGRTLALLPKLKAKLTGRTSARLGQLESRIDLCGELRDRLDGALADDCPLTSREGGFIRTEYSEELDQLRELMKGGKRWMAEYQAKAVAESGIPNIKVGFNKVFGYYLEVTHAHRDKVPAEFIRKQTLKNAERYITPELKEYEEKVLTAQERAFDLEHELFVELRGVVADAAKRLQATAAALAEIDVLAGLADLARSSGYVRPTIVDEPVLDITAGRHPVLDVLEPAGTFVPNDIAVSSQSEESAILLITGPNMAGKSTYIRQAALLQLLAQIGSFVPAERATVGVADRIFARVGASDDLAGGRSTFMVEMTETARILNTATRRSLVILDEIGRGTSTYDGLSLAWAVVEHLHNEVGCRTLFATHYHELTELADELPRAGNLNVAVKEWEGTVVFLHRIVAGAADKSYGIHVAELAGVPRGVNRRAEEILADLEGGRRRVDAPQNGAPRPSGAYQMKLFETVDHPLLEAIRSADLEQTTPLEALQLVAAWQRQLEGEAAKAKPR